MRAENSGDHLTLFFHLTAYYNKFLFTLQSPKLKTHSTFALHYHSLYGEHQLLRFHLLNDSDTFYLKL